MKRLIPLAFAITLMVAAPNRASAQPPQDQYYDPAGWQQHPTGKYMFLKYYFKENPTDPNYKLHYVVYYPESSNPIHREYLYYFNPTSRKYWCRALNYGNSKEYQQGQRKELWNVLEQ